MSLFQYHPPPPVQRRGAAWTKQWWAGVIDRFIVLAPLRIVAAVLSLWSWVPVVILGVLTFGLFGLWNGVHGQTPGKLATNIAVRDARTGQPIGLARGLAAEFIALAVWVLIVPGVLDVLWPLWDPQRQTLHDKAVGAIVADLS